MVERGDEDDRRRVGPLGERFDHVEPVAVAHLDVEQDHVGREGRDLGQRLGAGVGLADMLDIGDRLEQQLQPLQGERLVVDGQDAQQAHAAISSGNSTRTWKLPSASRCRDSATLASP